MITAKAIFLLIMQMQTLELNLSEKEKEEAYCLSMNVYYEAGSQSLAGKNAVAHVTLNRVKDKRYPSTICGVVKQAHMRDDVPFLPKRHQCAFSWYCDGVSDKGKFHRKDNTVDLNEISAYEQSVTISLMAILNYTVDPTNRATHYYSHVLVAKPYWAEYYTETSVIDHHTFYRREPRSLK